MQRVGLLLKLPILMWEFHVSTNEQHNTFARYSGKFYSYNKGKEKIINKVR